MVNGTLGQIVRSKADKRSNHHTYNWIELAKAGQLFPHFVGSTKHKFRACSECLFRRAAPQHQLPCFKVVCGWLLHCKSFLAISAVVFVSTVVCPACLRGGVVATGPDEFRERDSNRLIDLIRPQTLAECPCSWLTQVRIITSTSCISLATGTLRTRAAGIPVSS